MSRLNGFGAFKASGSQAPKMRLRIEKQKDWSTSRVPKYVSTFAEKRIRRPDVDQVGLSTDSLSRADANAKPWPHLEW